MKAEAAIGGGASEKEHVARWSKAVAKDKEPAVAFDQITDPGQIGDVYRYDRGPLLLLGLEGKVGGEKMKSFLRHLMVAPPLSTWNDLTSVAKAAGISDAKWTDWQQSCIRQNDAACLNP